MKTFIYSISLFLLLSFAHNSFSQNPSQIRPIKVVWMADGEEVSIAKAQKGIPVPSKLSLTVILNNKDKKKIEGQKLEFKWYRRGATRNYLTNSFIKQISTEVAKGNIYNIEAGRSNLKKGWWKVQVEAYIDRKLISFDNKQEFWINLK